MGNEKEWWVLLLNIKGKKSKVKKRKSKSKGKKKRKVNNMKKKIK